MSTYRVLIPDGESYFTSGVLRALGAARRYQCCVHARSPLAPARLSRQCSKFAVTDETAGFAERIVRGAREWSVDALLPIDEVAIGATIVARRELERIVQIPPLPAEESFVIARDKGQFAKFLCKHNLRHPATICLSSATAPALDGIRYPVLLKPTRSSNGIGIIRFETVEELSRHLAKHPEAAASSIVQSYVEGSDIDCSVLCVDGRVVAHTVQRQIGAGPGRFRAAGAIEFLEYERVAELATQIVGALRWSGVAHLDMRMDRDSGELYAIEMNPRFWGSLMGSVQAGVNFADLACRLALRQLLPAIERRNCQYLSGSAVIRSWLNQLPGQTPLATVRRTALRHILSDPGPEFVETVAALSRAGTAVGRRLLGFVREFVTGISISSTGG